MTKRDKVILGWALNGVLLVGLIGGALWRGWDVLAGLLTLYAAVEVGHAIGYLRTFPRAYEKGQDDAFRQAASW